MQIFGDADATQYYSWWHYRVPCRSKYSGKFVFIRLNHNFIDNCLTCSKYNIAFKADYVFCIQFQFECPNILLYLLEPIFVSRNSVTIILHGAVSLHLKRHWSKLHFLWTFQLYIQPKLLFHNEDDLSFVSFRKLFQRNLSNE